MNETTTPLDKVFLESRTFYKWQNKPLEKGVIEKIYNVVKYGPTSANCQPLRIIFIESEESKNKLVKCLDPGNIEKTLEAPMTAIFAYDERFYDNLPVVFPVADAKSWFVGNTELSNKTARLNSALQAAYFIIVARSFGVDCGPMSGFDNEICDLEFFKDTNIKSLFLCNLGYGNNESLYPRLPRLEFENVCKVL